MKMKRIIVVLLSLLSVFMMFVVSCSSPIERKKIVENTEFEIVYQERPNSTGSYDLFVTRRNDKMFIVKVNASAEIYSIIEIKGYKISPIS